MTPASRAQQARTSLIREIAQRARVDPARVTPDAHLITDLGLSSLDLLSVLAFAEGEFGARIPDELLATLTTLGRIEEAMERHRRSAGDDDVQR